MSNTYLPSLRSLACASSSPNASSCSYSSSRCLRFSSLMPWIRISRRRFSLSYDSMMFIGPAFGSSSFFSEPSYTRTMSSLRLYAHGLRWKTSSLRRFYSSSTPGVLRYLRFFASACSSSSSATSSFSSTS